MPELPEVESAARSLRRWLDGATVEKAQAAATRIFRGSDSTLFERELVGRRFAKVERRGKYLLIFFDGDVGLLSHLGMTGKWVCNSGEQAPSHERARLVLSTGDSVSYDDPRQFGRMAIHSASELLSLPEIRALGPDPLVDGVDSDVLFGQLQRSSRPVKVALMDQALIAGIGNIQATEGLFNARVHPARTCQSLSFAEVRAIVAGLETSIKRTLDIAGDEEIRYVSEANADNPFLIYGRAGSACPRCGTVLENMTLGGRASVLCPRCQPSDSRASF